MTQLIDIGNRALQALGSRTTMASLTEASNEAFQTNLVITQVRDELLRTAPWNCATNTAVLTYITSVPGTPENLFPAPPTWRKGLPAPPWAYEYQYPVDCLRPISIVPQFTTGFSGGVPITTAITGGVPSFWNGPPVRFKVGIDQFFSVSTIVPETNVGFGYNIGDIITLSTDFPPATPPEDLPTSPVGAAVQVRVTAINILTGVQTVDIINVMPGSLTPLGGSYFKASKILGPYGQASTTGTGTGATFEIQAYQPTEQRVILTNQEFAVLNYVRQIQDPNTMDPQFIEAWVSALAGRLVFQLTGDRSLANQKLQEANSFISQARISDGNEGLTINDVIPDWIRIRGSDPVGGIGVLGPNVQFDWGPMLTLY